MAMRSDCRLILLCQGSLLLSFCFFVDGLVIRVFDLIVTAILKRWMVLNVLEVGTGLEGRCGWNKKAEAEKVWVGLDKK